MKKQEYIQPEVTVVKIEGSLICASPVNAVYSPDTDITYGGAGAGEARTREQNVWDEEW